MLRRNFLQLPAAAALLSLRASARTPGYRLSVRVHYVFKGLPLERQMARVAEARFHAFEFVDWRAADPRAITALKNRLGLECACINGSNGVNPEGMTLVDPRDRQGFLGEIKAATEAARRYETNRLLVLTGNELPNVPRQAQHRSIVEGLQAAHEIVAPHNITMILEVLNTLVDHKGYYLNHTEEAFQIVREVNSPYVKILFDFYHVQIMDGNLIDTMRKNIGAIGHFHVADVPGRHEPGTGEINYRNVFKAIQAAKFTEYVAMEYYPLQDALKTLREVKTRLYEASA